MVAGRLRDGGHLQLLGSHQDQLRGLVGLDEVGSGSPVRESAALRILNLQRHHISFLLSLKHLPPLFAVSGAFVSGVLDRLDWSLAVLLRRVELVSELDSGVVPLNHISVDLLLQVVRVLPLLEVPQLLFLLAQCTLLLVLEP